MVSYEVMAAEYPNRPKGQQHRESGKENSLEHSRRAVHRSANRSGGASADDIIRSYGLSEFSSLSPVCR